MLVSYLRTFPVTLENAICTAKTMQQLRDLEALVFYIPHVSFCIEWTDIMAKKTSNFNLIDYRLSDAELDAFEQWIKKSPPSFAASMAEFAAMNYKVSLTYVENSESWCVSVTGRDDAKFNEGVTITTWADDVEEGILMAYYKVCVVFSKGKWIGKPKSNRG
jgi:hypothetical protein